MQEGLKVIAAGEERPLTDLDISERDWLLLAKDNLGEDSPANAAYSKDLPPFLLARFQRWGDYEVFRRASGGRRLFQPHIEKPTIIWSTSEFQIFPPERIDGLTLPNIEEGGLRGPYYVSRAFVGKTQILEALRFEGAARKFEYYAKLLEPQL